MLFSAVVKLVHGGQRHRHEDAPFIWPSCLLIKKSCFQAISSLILTWH